MRAPSASPCPPPPLVFALLVCGCASAPSHGEPTPRGSAVVAAAFGSAPSGASTGATPPPAREGKLVIATVPNISDIDEIAPGAKCDFSRPYRGKIGDTAVSLVLRPDPKDGSIVAGSSHYDREGESIAVRGKADRSSFTLDESPGGTFSGACDPATGVLSGTFTLGKTTTPFTLNPVPSDWPGLYTVTKSASAESHDPECLAIAKPNEPVPTSGWGVCPPTDPKKRKEFYKDAPDSSCSITDSSLRVFGMSDKAVEKKVNATLALTPFDSEIKTITACRSTPMNDSSLAFVVRLGGGLLVVDAFHSTYSGGAHPMNSKAGATTIDLATGDTVRLEDAVSDLGKLKSVAARCVALYNVVQGDITEAPLPDELPEAKCGSDGGMGFFLWGCTENPRPSLAIVPEGIVIAQSGNPHVSSVMDGWGPVIPWSVLLRDGVLPQESPIARVWKGVAPAKPDDLPCTAAYEGHTWRTWRAE